MADLKLTHPLVQTAINSMNAGNREAWYAVFSPDIILIDDGEELNFREWADGELFGEHRGYITQIDQELDEGLTLHAQFHSDRWGDFATFMKFTVENGQITRLEVGQLTS